MARWKARVEFLLSVTELPFMSLTVEALQGKMCQNSLPSGGCRSLGAKISGEQVVPGEHFWGFYKTRHILLFDSVNCTVQHAVVLTQYLRVTDGRTDGLTDRQTDGIAVASTALPMRRAVKMVRPMLSDRCLSVLFCLSVCNVGVLYGNAWMDQDKTWLAGRPRPKLC